MGCNSLNDDDCTDNRGQQRGCCWDTNERRCRRTCSQMEQDDEGFNIRRGMIRNVQGYCIIV